MTGGPLFRLGTDHACFTGDCGHDDANACVRELRSFVLELRQEVAAAAPLVVPGEKAVSVSQRTASQPKPRRSSRMQTVTQSRFGTCVPACIAMVLGWTEEQVLQHSAAELRYWKKHRAWFMPTQSMLAILLSQGYGVGLCIELDHAVPADLGMITVAVDILQTDALVSVPSLANSALQHMVVWDHEVQACRDPADGQLHQLDDYPVIHRWEYLWKTEEPLDD